MKSFQSSRLIVLNRIWLPSFFILLLFTLSTNAGPLWDPLDGILVSQDQDLTLSRSAIACQSDQTLIIWGDTEDVSYNLYGQVFDTDGDSVWQDAVLIAGGEDIQDNPYVIADGDGSWLVAYNQNQNFRAQKISAQGELLWQEENGDPELGVPVFESLYEYVRCNIINLIPDSDGGFYILTGLKPRSGETDLLIVQRISENGNIAEDWPEDGIVITNRLGGFEESHNDFAARGNDGIWILYVTNNGWNDFDTRLIAIDGDGNNVLDDPIELSNDSPFRNSPAAIVIDGIGGCYCSWNTGGWTAPVVQRFNEQGEPHWTNGAEILREGFQNVSKIAMIASAEESATIVWSIDGNSSDTLFTQKFGGDDEIEFLWDENGTSIYSSPPQHDIMHLLKLSPLDDGDLAIRFSITNAQRISPHELLATKLSSLGGIGNVALIYEDQYGNYRHPNFKWPGDVNSNGLITQGWIENHQNGEEELTIHRTDLINETYPFGGDGLVIRAFRRSLAIPDDISVYDDEVRIFCRDLTENDSDGIYLTRFDLETGVSLGEPSSLFANNLNNYLDVFMTKRLKSVTNNDGVITVFVLNPDADTLLTTEDVLAQRVGSDGTLLWGDNGLDLGDATGYSLEIADAGDGTIIAAWQTIVDEENGIALQCFDENGEGLWFTDEYPFTFIPTGEYSSLSNIVQLDDEQWMIAINSDGYLYSAVSFDIDGQIIWDNDYDELEDYYCSRIEKAEGGVFLILRGGYHNLAISFVDSDGSPMWDEPTSFQYAYSLVYLRFSTAGPDATSAWFAVSEYSSNIDNRAYVQQIDTNGDVLFEPHNGILLEDVNQCELNITSNNTAWLITQTVEEWPDFRDLSYLHIDSSGNFFDEYTNGAEDLDVSIGIQGYPTIVNDGEDGLIVTWRDHLGDASHVLAQRLEMELTGIAKDEGQNLLAEQFQIDIVYPNPFNSIVNVVLQLPVAGKLRVTVYDVLGREVVVLAENHYPVGKHTLTFNTNSMSSGVYFIRANLDGRQAAIRKVMLLR